MSQSTLPETAFAPAERELFDTIESQAAMLEGSEPLRSILSWLPAPVAVVNGCRQIVFANQALLELLAVADAQPILGLRIGEAFGCPNSTHDLGGCGTTEWCRGCGVVSAVTEALEKGQAAGRYTINEKIDDRRVRFSFEEAAFSFECGGTRFVLVLLRGVPPGGLRI